jgi:hypothetical protein
MFFETVISTSKANQNKSLTLNPNQHNFKGFNCKKNDEKNQNEKKKKLCSNHIVLPQLKTLFLFIQLYNVHELLF